MKSAAAASVVTNRAVTKPFMDSATQRNANRRPRDPRQWSRCSPSADNSIGDVSAVLLIAIRTYRLIFHPEQVHDAKIKTAE